MLFISGDTILNSKDYVASSFAPRDMYGVPLNCFEAIMFWSNAWGQRPASAGPSALLCWGLIGIIVDFDPIKRSFKYAVGFGPSRYDSRM